MKPISFWLTVTDGRGREGGEEREGERPFGNKEREDDFGHRRGARAAEVFELNKNEGERKELGVQEGGEIRQFYFAS